MLTERQIQRLIDVAGAATQVGRVNESRAILDGVLALKPSFAPALIAQAFTHVVVDDYEGAKGLLNDHVLGKNPNDADALAMLGLALLLQGDKGEAVSVLSRIPTEHPAGELAKTLMTELN